MDLHGYPHVLLGCAICALGILRPEGDHWRCGFCNCYAELTRVNGRLVQR